jgi:hypothetical protein
MTIKKILMTSAALTVFAISATVFQMSGCKKANAQSGGTNYTLPPATSSTLGGVIVGNGLSVTSNGTLALSTTTNGLTQLNKIIFSKLLIGGGTTEIWTMNYDGSNKTKINIVMPAGEEIQLGTAPKLSPDGQKVIFMGRTIASTNNDDDIYICNIDGTSVTKIYDMPVGTGHTAIGGAY